MPSPATISPHWSIPGGTTGLPKIVKLSHRTRSYRHWTLELAQQLVFGEVILHDTPMFHVGGLIGRNRRCSPAALAY